MSTMLRTRRQPVYVVQVDERAALAWERKGWFGRFLTLLFAQEKAAYQRAQHHLWSSYRPAPVKRPNPMLLSQQLRKR